MAIKNTNNKKMYRQGAVGALLDEYERAVMDLEKTINDISDEELIKVIDNNTSDPNCKSIQTILSHVVRAGYAYAIDIRKLAGEKIDKPEKLFHMYVSDYQKDLNSFFLFTIETFKNVNDNQLEQFENSKKIKSAWGQFYDIEQLAEHAIVHILRHRRQIEKFKIVLREHK